MLVKQILMYVFYNKSTNRFISNLQTVNIGFQLLLKWIAAKGKTEPKDILVTLEATGVYHESVVFF